MPIQQISLGQTPLPDLSTEAVQQHLAQATLPLWLDVLSPPCEGAACPAEDDLTWLAHTFGFHPLTLEDCRHFNQRSKLEEYDGYLFISMTLHKHSPDKRDILLDEIQVFLGKNYLVTVHNAPLPALDLAPALYTKETEPARQQADFLFYHLADVLVDGYFPLMDEMDDEIDDLEDQVLQNATQDTLHRIFALKQQLVQLRKVAGPLRDAMNALAGRSYAQINNASALYFRNIYDHLTRIYEIIETSRDLLGNALDAYLSTVSNRLSEVMKRLTLVTTIFMPISFLVGFGGMNFTRFIPFEEPWAFALLISLMVMAPITMVVWFWRSKWV